MATASSVTSLWNAKPEWGGLKTHYFTFATGTVGYSTGGYDCDFTNYNLGTILLVSTPKVVAGYSPEYNYTTKKLLFYCQDCDGLADGPLIEYAGGAALDSQTFTIKVEGHGV